MSDRSVMTRIMNEWRRRETSGADTSSVATPEEADAASDVPALPDGASAMAGASLAMREYRNLLREAPTDVVTDPSCSVPTERAENCSWLDNGYVDPASDPGMEVELPAGLLDIEGMAGRPYREVARALVRNGLLPQRPAILFCGESEARRTAARTASVLAGAARRRVLVIDASGEGESRIPAIAGMTKFGFSGMTASALGENDALCSGDAGGRGFEQVLWGECSLAEVLRRTSLANLRWMTSGRRRDVSRSNFDLLERLMRFRPKSADGDRPSVGQVRKVLFPLKAAFDMVLVAAPPVGGDDFEALGGACDAAVQLVRMNSPARAARATADAIRGLGLLPAGCVVIES